MEMMATLACRALSAATVQVRGKVLGGTAFSRHCAYARCARISSSPHLHIETTHRLYLPQANKPVPQSSSCLLSKDVTGPNYQLQFLRALSSEATSLEDETNVYYEGLVERINSGDIQLIDVREPSELAEFGQITNSFNVPLGELEDALRLPEDRFQVKYNRTKPKETDDNVVFHCRSGVRSLKAVNAAREIGYTKARHFPGGWLQWAEKNNLPSA